jgi:hypothetical protein
MCCGVRLSSQGPVAAVRIVGASVCGFLLIMSMNCGMVELLSMYPMVELAADRVIRGRLRGRVPHVYPRG